MTDELSHPPFRPGPLLRNRHLMTMSLLLPRRRSVLRRAEPRWFEVGADGQRVLGMCSWSGDEPAPTVVVMHGFTGSAESAYCLGVARKLLRAGFHVVRLNARGSGGTASTVWPLGHYGYPRDLAIVLRELSQDPRVGPLLIVGFSMGGNQALMLAGEVGRGEGPCDMVRGVDVRGVVAVSPALDVAACVSAVDSERQLRPYLGNFMRTLRRMMREHVAEFGVESVDYAAIRRAQTIREFDTAYTTSAWGFRDIEDFYARSTALRVTDSVAWPTLVIASRDDPLVPFSTLPKWNDQVEMLVADHGGHLAFRAGSRGLDPDRQWAENRAVDWCVRRVADWARASEWDGKY